jgi:proline iminopeptidase
MWHGFWLFAGLGNLAAHKKLGHIIDQASFVDTSYVEEIEISRDDNRRPPPVRAAWPGYLRRSNAHYRDRLDELQLPVLLCVGRHDPQTPPVMSRELHDGINGSELVVFESSGHAPFVEQEAEFVCVLREFLLRP